MYTFLVRRIVATIPVFGMVALFVFFMLRLASGDPAAILAGDNGTPDKSPKFAPRWVWTNRSMCN